ncbi:MAG: glycosyltransferase [Chlorobium sp.]|nr:MAG: glycosyltransferase [Chlorobium sp.]
MLVSIYIITYNHSSFVTEAIEGALSQTYSPLEIIISDDASTDNTCEKIENIIKDYHGKHKIKYLRNKKNLGIAKHITKVLKECTGEWIFASAGDDISEKNRVELMVDQYKKNPDLLLIQSYLREIDVEGNELYINTLNDNKRDIQNSLITWSAEERVEKGNIPHTHGAGFAYSRKILEIFGIELSEKIMFEDNVFDWRAELLSAIGMIRVPLVRHRNHDGQTTRSVSSDKRQRVELMRRVVASDLETTLLNIQDLSLLHKQSYLSDQTYYSCMPWLQRRLSAIRKKYEVLNTCLPMRYHSLLCYLLSNHSKEFTFNRRDIYSLLFP